MADLEYDAILVDTSIFDGNGLKLESGLLGKLKQFAKSPVEFIMPDVIKNEIQTHLDRKIKVARNALEKSINDAHDHLFFDGSALNTAKKLIVDSQEVEGLAKARLDKFIDDTDAFIIDCDDYVSVKELLGVYFQNKPPFSETGKKKNEFPDAIVLLAVEHWADKEGKKVLAVAKDKDWEAYCEHSKNIDYIEDFSKGLSKFNAATAPYALLDNLKKALEEGNAAQFLSRVEFGLKSALDGFTPDQEADSQHYWEAEGSHGWFESFTLCDYDFTIIDTDDDWIVIEVFADITVGATGDFSLEGYDPIDRDNIPFGSISVSTQEEFLSDILITLSGNLNGDINQLEVEDVEIVDPISSIDFGTLEINYVDYD